MRMPTDDTWVVTALFVVACGGPYELTGAVGGRTGAGRGGGAAGGLGGGVRRMNLVEQWLHSYWSALRKMTSVDAHEGH